jgi:hypothetical protein
MSEPTKANSANCPTSPSRFSLDAWAVSLALALAILVWSGVIKHIPW